jgi:thimet oligopeptidase
MVAPSTKVTDALFPRPPLTDGGRLRWSPGSRAVEAVAAAPAPAPAPVKAPPALEEPLGAAAARISGPAAAFTAACQEAMTRAKAGLDAVKAAPAPRDPVATLTTYDDANAAISDAGAQAELARQGSPDPAMRKAAEDCDRQLQAMFTAINQDRALYDVLSSLDLSGQDVTTRWWISRDLREFRRAGVDRDDATRRRSARSPTSW